MVKNKKMEETTASQNNAKKLRPIVVLLIRIDKILNLNYNLNDSKVDLGLMNIGDMNDEKESRNQIAKG